MSALPSIEEVWRRIEVHQGEEFSTITGLAFTYLIDDDVLTTSRTDFPLRIGEFAKALALVPIPGPGGINDLVRGPAYVWAILHDKRIRQADW